MVCVDTRGLCFLCYKSCEDSIDYIRSVEGDDSFDSGRASDHDELNQDSSRRGCETKKYDNGIAKQTNLFCKILFRILGFNPMDHCTSTDKKRIMNNNNKQNNMQLQMCTDCLRIASNVCEICHEISSLKLLLNWKLMRIRDTMKSADKAPSRSSAFKNVFKCAEESNQSESLMNASGPQEELNEIQTLRKNIIRKCKGSEKLQNARPKVVLNRLAGTMDPRHQKENKNPEQKLHTKIKSSKIISRLLDCSESDQPQASVSQHQHCCPICSKAFSKKKNLQTHMKLHLNVDNNKDDDGKGPSCGKLDAGVDVDTDNVKLISESSESKSPKPALINEAVDTEIIAAVVLPKLLEAQLVDQEEDEPPPVPIEIDTNLAPMKETDNDEDFHPSDVDGDDISSDDYGIVDFNCSMDKNEGRKRKRKTKVKCSSPSFIHEETRVSAAGTPACKKTKTTKIT